jgi:2-polyprenyl-3-methyl-5-hydroxy-6-metoxy-1,4-benzoquinol methylase
MIRKVSPSLGALIRYYACKDRLALAHRNGDIVVDIGCYDGFILSKLNMAGLAIGLDLNKNGLRIAKQRGLHCILASGLQNPLRDEIADVALLLDVIEHVKRHRSLLYETNRILKRGGILILTTPIKNKKLMPFIDMKKVHRSWGHVREGYSYEEIIKLLNDSNFRILELTTFSHFLSRGVTLF